MEQMTRVNPTPVSIKDGFILVLGARTLFLHSTCTRRTKEKENLENRFFIEGLHHARKVLGKCAIVLGYNAESPTIESTHTPGRFAVYPQHCILSMR